MDSNSTSSTIGLNTTAGIVTDPTLNDANTTSAAVIPVVLVVVLLMTALLLFAVIFPFVRRRRGNKSGDLERPSLARLTTEYSYTRKLPVHEAPIVARAKRSSVKKEPPPALQYSDLPTGKDEPEELSPGPVETPTTPPGAQRSDSFDVVLEKDFLTSRRSILETLASVGLDPWPNTTTQKPKTRFNMSAISRSSTEVMKKNKEHKQKKSRRSESMKNISSKRTLGASGPVSQAPPHFQDAKNANDRRKMSREERKQSDVDDYKYHREISASDSGLHRAYVNYI